MQSIEIVLALLAAVVASGYLVRAMPLSVPLPLLQIALGALISGVLGQGTRLNPEIFFLAFLPPLLFLDGWRIPKVGLFRDKGTIFELAFGLVVFTVLGAGFLIHWLIPTMPLAVAFALAAIVSPTDPVAVSSIASRVRIPKRLLHILEGESLLNDASGLVCFRFAVAAAVTGTFSIGAAALTFLWVALAGIAIGASVTLAITLAHRWLSDKLGEESGSSILVNVLTPFAAYLIAEHLDASGILAAVAAGVTMSYVELSGRALASTRVQRTAVWDMIQFSLNGIMFVLLGEQLPEIVRRAAASVDDTGHLSPWWLLVYALAISAILLILRFTWAWVSLRLTMFLARHRGESTQGLDWRIVAVVAVSGVRGTITLAGVLSLPFNLPSGLEFPARDLVIFLAASVILISLLLASLTLPFLLRRLQLPDEPSDHREEDLARRKGAEAAIAAVERVVHSHAELGAVDAELYTSAAVRVIAGYQHQLEYSSLAGGVGAETLRDANRAEAALRLAALQAEREEIFRLARQNEISDELSRKLVRQIDLAEARFQ